MDFPAFIFVMNTDPFHSASEKLTYFFLRLFVPFLILFFLYFPFTLLSFFPPFLSFCISLYFPFRFLFSPFLLLFSLSLFPFLSSSSFCHFTPIPLLLSLFSLSFFIPLLPVSSSCSFFAPLHSVQQCSTLTNNVSICYSNLQRGSRRPYHSRLQVTLQRLL
jgi:hypothetical protein